MRGEDGVLRGDVLSKRAGDPLAEPPAGPPEADWCPPESDTMQVRPGADEGAGLWPERVECRKLKVEY